MATTHRAVPIVLVGLSLAACAPAVPMMPASARTFGTIAAIASSFPRVASTSSISASVRPCSRTLRRSSSTEVPIASS